jgi:hypothetical protein
MQIMTNNERDGKRVRKAVAKPVSKALARSSLSDGKLAAERFVCELETKIHTHRACMGEGQRRGYCVEGQMPVDFVSID